MKNFYREFNLSEFTSREELCNQLYAEKRKWLTKQNSADLNKRHTAEQKILLIDEALEVFSDSEKFKKYNASLCPNGNDEITPTEPQSLNPDSTDQNLEAQYWEKKDTDSNAELYLINKYSQSGDGDVSKLNYRQTKYVFDKCTLRSADFGKQWIQYAIDQGNPFAEDIKFGIVHIQNKVPDKASSTAKQPSTEKKKLIIIVLAITAIVIIGIIALTSLNAKTTVDLVSVIKKPTFIGYDEGGHIDGYAVADDDYTAKGTKASTYNVEKSDASEYYISGNDNFVRIDQLLDTVTYKIDHYSDLSNGDTVTITAKYDKELAKQLNIEVKKSKVTYKVSGLTERYSSGKDIKIKAAKAILKYEQDCLTRDLRDDETLLGVQKLMFVRENEITNGYASDTFDDVLITIFEVKSGSDIEYYVYTVNPFYPSLTFEDNVDRLDNQNEISINHMNCYDDPLDKVIKDIKKEHLRDTVFDLDVAKYTN